MPKDDRDNLELLKDELDFIQKRGCGRSVRTPWQTKSIFRDSRSCINYGYPYRAHPFNECHMLEFLPLNTDGDTIEDLELRDKEAKFERGLSDCLHAKVKEEQRVDPAIA